MAGKTKPKAKVTKPSDHTSEDKLDTKVREFFTPSGTDLKPGSSMASVSKVFKGRAVAPNGKKIRFVVYGVKNIFGYENGYQIGQSLAARWNYKIEGDVTWDPPSAAGIGLLWKLPAEARELPYVAD